MHKFIMDDTEINLFIQNQFKNGNHINNHMNNMNSKIGKYNIINK